MPDTGCGAAALPRVDGTVSTPVEATSIEELAGLLPDGALVTDDVWKAALEEFREKHADPLVEELELDVAVELLGLLG
jgi:hypothetical protein